MRPRIKKKIRKRMREKQEMVSRKKEKSGGGEGRGIFFTVRGQRHSRREELDRGSS